MDTYLIMSFEHVEDSDRDGDRFPITLTSDWRKWLEENKPINFNFEVYKLNKSDNRFHWLCWADCDDNEIYWVDVDTAEILKNIKE